MYIKTQLFLFYLTNCLHADTDCLHLTFLFVFFDIFINQLFVCRYRLSASNFPICVFQYLPFDDNIMLQAIHIIAFVKGKNVKPLNLITREPVCLIFFYSQNLKKLLLLAIEILEG